MNRNSWEIGRLRAAFAILACIGVMTYILFVGRHFSGRLSRDVVDIAAGLPFVLWWSGPSIIYWLGVRTLLGSIAGLLLPVLTVYYLHSIYSENSSTMGIPLFVLPVKFYAASIGLVVIDRAFLIGRRRLTKAKQSG